MSLFHDPELTVGEVAWFHDGQHNLSGTVMYVFPAGVFGHGHPSAHYVIEIKTHVDDYLIMRSAWHTYREKGQHWLDGMRKKGL